MIKNSWKKNNRLLKNGRILLITLMLFLVTIIPSVGSDPICITIIGDYVWEDMNFDGIQDQDEPGIDEITVELYTCEDEFICSTYTTDGGFYEFVDIDPGSYYVKFILPQNYIFTLQNIGSDDTIDSDADQSTGKTECTYICYGETDDTWDAGLYQRASIGDFVWNDINQDGIQNIEEPGIDGVTVELYTCEDFVIASTVTSEGGMYEFSDVIPNCYYLKFILPENYEFTCQDAGGDNTKDSDADTETGITSCFDISPGENDDTWDAGMYIIDYFYLNINVVEGCGWVKKTPDLPFYEVGTIVQLTAYPNISGFEFHHWSGDLSGNNNPEFITMDSNKTVNAHFSFVEYELIINIDGSGYVEKDPDKETYHFNDIVELTAFGNPGWKFNHWSGDYCGTDNPIRIQINYVKTITAHFKYYEYALTVNVEGSGNVEKDPDMSMYPDGTIVELTAVADPGYRFDTWLGDITSSSNPEQITMDSEKSVTARFISVAPPSIPTIDGPNEIQEGIEYRFTICSSDPNNHDIWYYIDWGNGDIEEWIGPHNSGDEVNVNHMWYGKQTYTIKVKARNTYLSESSWGSMDVSVPRVKFFRTPLIVDLLRDYLELFPFLKLFILLLNK